MRKFFALLVLMLLAGGARADWAVRASSSAAVAITVPASQGGYCSLVVRQNNTVSNPSTAFTVWVGAVKSGDGTAVASHRSYRIPCVTGQTFAARAVVGWIQASSAGSFEFAVVGRYPPGFTVLSTGRLAYWKFDENSGNAAADATGNGYDGVIPLVGVDGHTPVSHAWVPGVLGSAIQFTAVDPAWNNAGVVVNKPLGIIGDFSIGGWVKIPATLTGYLLFVASSDGSFTENFQFGGGMDFNTDSPAMAVWPTVPGKGPHLYAIRRIDDGLWHHVACTRSGAVWSLYIDGALDSSDTLFSDAFDFSAPVSGGGVGLMQSLSPAGQLITGDEWGFWTRALTAGEVAELYNSGAGKSF